MLVASQELPNDFASLSLGRPSAQGQFEIRFAWGRMTSPGVGEAELTFVVVKEIAEDLDVRTLVQGQSRVRVAVRRVVGDGGVVTAAMEHDAILTVVVYVVVPNAHVVTPFRGDWRSRGFNKTKRGVGSG